MSVARDGNWASEEATRFVRAHGPRLHGLCLLFAWRHGPRNKRHDLARDALTEVWLAVRARAASGRPPYTSLASLAYWAVREAQRSACRPRSRIRAVDPPLELSSVPGPSEAEEMTSPTPRPGWTVADEAAFRCDLRAALDSLPARVALVVRHRIDGRLQQEIATLLGLCRRTIGEDLARARPAFAPWLEV